jgi:hypothetical protein
MHVCNEGYSREYAVCDKGYSRTYMHVRIPETKLDQVF